MLAFGVGPDEGFSLPLVVLRRLEQGAVTDEVRVLFAMHIVLGVRALDRLSGQQRAFGGERARPSWGSVICSDPIRFQATGRPPPIAGCSGGGRPSLPGVSRREIVSGCGQL
jgi:hypothetical protein